jgi:cytochrome c
MSRIILVGAGLLVWAAAAQAQVYGDADQGSRLARRVCSTCHVVDIRSTVAPNDGVPSFPWIAQQKNMTASALAAFLSTSHPPMPDLVLTRDEIRQVSAYILSMRKPD